MVAKRIIPCLDVKDGRTVKGINFVGLQDVGDAVELGKRYAEQGADELVYLDITATHEGRGTFTKLVERISAEIDIPFTVGGADIARDERYERLTLRILELYEVLKNPSPKIQIRVAEVTETTSTSQ